MGAFRTGVGRALHRVADRLGFDLVRRHYYSPIPDLRQLPASVFERESELPGVDLRIEEGLRLLEGELARYLQEFQPPRTAAAAGPGRYFLENDVFETVDADVLYAMVRHHKPRRIIELGSGLSTFVELEAIAANRRDGHETELTVFDPYPGSGSGVAVEDVLGDSLERIGATDVPLQHFDALEAGDILFVDTTHTVKLGGDVNRIILEILPRLAPGVYVHLHDVFLPYEYPRQWFEDHRWFWSEQYLLQAFLIGNRGFQVVFAARAATVKFPGRVAAAVPSFEGSLRPNGAGSFWMRRCAPNLA
jgi:hypothetical protein